MNCENKETAPIVIITASCRNKCSSWIRNTILINSPSAMLTHKKVSNETQPKNCLIMNLHDDQVNQRSDTKCDQVIEG